MTGLPSAAGNSTTALLGGAAAIAAGFALTAILTRPWIGWVNARRYVKALRVDGPDHAAKAGTPTMGGLALLAVLTAIALVAAVWRGQGADLAAAAIVVAALWAFAGAGLLDDLRGIASAGRGREIGVGLTARRMLALQLLLAAAVWLAMRVAGLGGAIAAGGSGLAATGGGALIAVVALVGTVNGVNMSDGLDGLAAGLAAIAFASLGAVLLGATGAGWPGDAPHGLAIASLGAAGACLGFLVYNRHPARVFMGNVTSMGLGAALATVGLVSGMWWLLPILGLVFAGEVVSVLAQVAYFKATGGRRLLRMAPIHHHFEKGGMPETQVVGRFWIAGLLSGAAALAIAYFFSSA